jgi:hypothetical protein
MLSTATGATTRVTNAIPTSKINYCREAADHIGFFGQP